MGVDRVSFVVPADQRTVAGLLRDSAVATEALARAGHGYSARSRLLVAGDRVDLRVRALPGLRLPAATVIESITPDGMTSSLLRGPLKSLRHTTVLVPDDAGTRVHDEITWRAPLGFLADRLLLAATMRRILGARAAVLAERVAALASARVVVATAIVRDGRVLAARRSRPAAVDGRWELPGGSVEPGETEPDAVVRECREEMAAEVRAAGRLGTDLPIDVGVLRVHLAALVAGGPEPRPLEHRELRWVGPAELDALDWVDADRAVLPELAATLRA